MKPLILDFAVERKGDVNIIYEYDFHKSLNTIEVNSNKINFIDSTIEDISLITKTKVKSESDDNDYNLLELKTKTEVHRERDDNHYSLLELQTKTFTKQERDD